MAKFNEILNARIPRMLQKFFSMKGPIAVPVLGTELAPNITVFSGVENRFLESWDRFGARVFVAANAANSGGVRLRNPSTSGAIVVIEKLTVGTNAAAATEFLPQVGPIANDMATVFTYAVQRLDSRSRPNPSTILSSQNTTPANIGIIGDLFLTATVGTLDFILDENQEITLLPGDAFQVVDNIVNQAFGVGLMWRERPIEDSEKF